MGRAVILIFLGLASCRSPAGDLPVPVVDPCAYQSAASPADSITIAVPAARVRSLTARLLSSEPVADCQGTSRPTLVWYRDSGPADSVRKVLVPTDSSVPVIRMQAYPASWDPRDLIDQGVDLVITDAPQAIEYAITRGDRRTVPLAWSTTYALAFAPGDPPPAALTENRGEELARDAVRADARPATRPAWWDDPPCRVQPNTPVVRLPGIAIAGNDPIARALAERLVALAASPAFRRVIGLDPAQLDSVARRGAAAGFVIGLPDQRPANCEALPLLPAGWLLIPLVQTRATAIVGPRVPSFLFANDGTLVFLPARP